MTPQLLQTITLVISLMNIVGVVFAVYLHVRNPQIKSDQVIIKLQEDYVSLQKQVTEVKETHLRAVESDIRILTTAVNDLSKTVVRLSTIIDERIPKNIRV